MFDRLEGERRYIAQLDIVDLKIAQIDRELRKLRGERGRVERSLDEIERVVREIAGEDIDFSRPRPPFQEFFEEHNELQSRLNEIDLAIIRLGRDRDSLRKEKKALEKTWNGCGPLAFI